MFSSQVRVVLNAIKDGRKRKAEEVQAAEEGAAHEAEAEVIWQHMKKAQADGGFWQKLPVFQDILKFLKL